MVASAAQCRIGTSGFHYAHWRTIFYPEDLPRHAWFAFYAQHFDTLEVNNTFYRVPDSRTFQMWRSQAPRGFLFALKFSRFATHNKKLLTPGETLDYFLDRAQPLLSRVRPILLQLPPRWRANPARLDAFLTLAPRRFHWAVEMRDPSWLSDDIFAILEKHSAALCIHDILPDHPHRLTADWIYIRFHGASAGSKYAGNYTDAQLKAWAREIRAWLRRGIDVYAYFNNDQGGHAIRNALELRDLLGLPPAGLAPRQSTPRQTAPRSPRARARR